MSNTKKEHYIPEVYLNNFAIAGDKEAFTHIFSVKKMEILRNPKNDDLFTVDSQCREDYLYEIRNENDEIIDKNRYEKLFNELEGRFSEVINDLKGRLSNVDILFECTLRDEPVIIEKNLEILKIYIMSQILRHPKVLDLAEDEYKKSGQSGIESRNNAIKNCLKFLDYIYSGDRDDPIAWRDFADKMDKNNIAYIIYQKWINNALYCFVKADTDCFFTSDSPFFIYDEKQLAIPLTSNIGLIISKSENGEIGTKIYNNNKKLINYIRETIAHNADKCIYSKNELSESDIKLITNARKKGGNRMSYFNIVAATNENTVVTEYTPEPRTAEAYQSEADLEKEFIRRLGELGYEYLTIHKEDDLIVNLRAQLEKLNNYSFSDSEWKRFFNDYIANANEGIVEKTRTIQEDHVKTLKHDDGTSKNITLIDKKNIHNNFLQVINQYAVDTGSRKNRYDVTVLVNGFPLVHIELKRRGVPIREAFNQINRYQRDSFWSGSGLYEYVQIFVISNGTNTKYYSNTTRDNAVKNAQKSRNKTKTSNSFEFTSFWADANNKVIPDLVDFTKTFFAKHTILNILTKYCVFTAENMLLVMRPYQIVATERILNRIEIANNYKKYGSVAGGGYIWHTTGSGKTLTSFKSARLASKLDYIDKVLFVVDRKDLDYQTMREYDRFEKGAANSNTSTTVLKRQLENADCHIIITTIQKLASFIKKNPTHDVYDKRVVIIFDECHRSQFGDMHAAIVKKFKKYHLFGFTSTPIFAVNTGSVKNPNLCTTEQAFGDQLHTYTIVDAINDKNVLPFRVDYIKTMDKEEDIEDVKVWDIDRERAYMSPKRIKLVTEYILNHFNQKTYRNERTYSFNVVTNISEVAADKRRTQVQEIKQKQHINGFNSIFAVSSVQAAKLYYEEFMKQMEVTPEKALKIAVIYSYGANEEDPDGLIDEENPEDTSALDSTSRDFLEKAIKDYNKQFNTNYDTSSNKFQNYYKDVSLRMKNKELDMLIVVNMFLTGFDATTLNTLWVDKKTLKCTV